MAKVWTLTICLLNLVILRTAVISAQKQLHCVSCDGITCPPEPTGCVLDRIPCGCCNVCSLTNGQVCHGFSPSCGPGLSCATPGKLFDERPPFFSTAHGFCVYTNAPTPAQPSITQAPTPPLPVTLAGVIGRKK